MRNTILILMILTFSTSCRTDSRISNINSPQVTIHTNKTVEVQPAISPTTSPIDTSGIDSKVGIVGVFGVKYEEGRLDESGKYQEGRFDDSREFICLTTQNSTLKSGDKIQIILAEIPQKVFQTEVSEKLKERCSSDLIGEHSSGSSPDFSYDTSYSLKFSENIYYGIAVINSSNQVKIDKGLAHIDLDNDGKDEYFRECYGRESLSLSIWQGKPLIGKRIWHGYFAFNWDTGTESCKRKDFEGVKFNDLSVH